MRRKPHSCLSRFVRSANSRRKPVRKFTAHVSVKMRGGSRNGMLERARLVAAPVLGLVSQGLQRVIEPFQRSLSWKQNVVNEPADKAGINPAEVGPVGKSACCSGPKSSTSRAPRRVQVNPAPVRPAVKVARCMGSLAATSRVPRCVQVNPVAVRPAGKTVPCGPVATRETALSRRLRCGKPGFDSGTSTDKQATNLRQWRQG